MTQQIRDRLVLDGEEHAIPPIDLSNCRWQQVRRYISSVQKFSACWRGYHCKWELRNGHLFLVDITIMWSGRKDWLEFEEVFPGQLSGVPGDWFSGEIEVPQGERLDLGRDYWMDEETLMLSISNGVVISARRRDNRQDAADRARRIAERYASVQETVAAAKLNPPPDEPEEPATEIEAQCDEFMMAAMMGTIDEADVARWRRFYVAVKDSASPEESLLLEVVNNAILRRE
ncbi:MAG: hypothetical protein WCT47_01225 [Betaproteobacteria bacterium]